MMNRPDRQSHVIDLFFTLSLFCLFAASAFLVVLIGSGVYRNTAAHMQENYAVRTTISYVAEKIRQHDTAGGTSLTNIDGETVLMFTDSVEDNSYDTYIYHYDGYLCELVIRKGSTFSKDQGEQILAVDSLSFSDEGNGFIRVTVSDSGSVPTSCLLHLRSDTVSASDSE